MHISDNVFYDEPIPAHKLEKNNASHVFPPDGLNLSDAWVVKIVQSDLRKEDRYKRWPAVFSSRLLKTSYQNKGTASKHQDSTKQWRYDLLFGNFEMHGEEGRNAGMIFDYGKKTTTKAEIRDGHLCVSQNAAATSADEAGTATPGTTKGSPAAANTSQATPVGPTTTKGSPAAANTEPNQSSRDAAINVGATSVTTRNRAKRQDSASAKKEGPPPKRQRQNIAGETSKQNPKTTVSPYYIPDIIKSEEELKPLEVIKSGKNDVTKLKAENAELRSRLDRSERELDKSERKLRKSERKIFLLAETLAEVHESVQPLIFRTTQAAERIRKSVEIAVEQNLNENDMEELKEMREFAWNNKTVVEGLVKGGVGAMDKVLSVSPNLGKMVFSHNPDAKQELAAWLNGTRPDWGTRPALGNNGGHDDSDGNGAEDSDDESSAGSASD